MSNKIGYKVALGIVASYFNNYEVFKNSFNNIKETTEKIMPAFAITKDSVQNFNALEDALDESKELKAMIINELQGGKNFISDL